MEQFEKLINDIREIRQNYSGKISFSTSLGMEDQVITAAIATLGHDIEVFTLDTGRLFPQSYELLERTETKYGLRIHVYSPDQDEVENYVKDNGINAFYKSTELRKTCCEIRKINPLKRALSGAEIWITGLRATQSAHRNEFKTMMFDDAFQVQKFNPLVDWTLDDVERTVEQLNIPVNPLHKQGFKSIGCAPCTRALEPGEPERSGRWWWENSKKECGLHSTNS